MPGGALGWGGGGGGIGGGAVVISGRGLDVWWPPLSAPRLPVMRMPSMRPLSEVKTAEKSGDEPMVLQVA